MIKFEYFTDILLKKLIKIQLFTNRLRKINDRLIRNLIFKTFSLTNLTSLINGPSSVGVMLKDWIRVLI